MKYLVVKDFTTVLEFKLEPSFFCDKCSDENHCEFDPADKGYY